MTPISGSFTGTGVAPSLVSVELAGSTIRVHFSEAMSSDVELNDPTNYTLTPLAGGDAVTVLSVAPSQGMYPLYVDLTLSNPTTGGSSYELEVDPALEDAVGNPMDAGGLTLTFLGFGTGAVALDDLGLIQAITGVFGEEMAEFGGFRMTRLTAAATEGDTTLYIESALDWAEDGQIAIDGVKYTYSSRILDAVYGIEHVAAGVAVAGAATDHRDGSTVVDLNRDWSGVDLLRQGFLVNYAESEDLDALGRNLGVNRPPIFTGDDQFREVIKALAYNPKGTVLGLELALEALIGEGNYEVYEDLIQFPNTVFIRVDTDAFLEATAAGRAILNVVAWDDLSGSIDTLVLSETPLAVGGVKLKDLDELFDFRNDKPSAVTYEYWPGETPDIAFSYTGSESEATQVIVTAGEYVAFTSLGTGSIDYTMNQEDGARITEDSYVEVTFLAAIDSGGGSPHATNLAQFSLTISDRAFLINLGYNASGVGLYASVGGGHLDAANAFPHVANVFNEYTVKKFGQSHVEFWVDGKLYQTQPYSAFTTVTTKAQIIFGIQATPVSVGFLLQYKQFTANIVTTTDYWAIRGAAGAVATANPTQFDDTGSELAAGDVGKYLTISGGTVANGINNGHWLITSYVSPGVVEVAGPVRDNAATVASTDRIVVDDPEAFTYPDDIGKSIVITGSALGNDGTYVIASLYERGTVKDYSSYATPITGAKTNIVDVVSGSFTAEPNLEWQLVPIFQTETGLDWVLSDASSFSGDTLTLRDSPPAINGVVMEVHYTNVLSAQLLENVDIENTVDLGPPVTYTYWPFYLADPFGLVQDYLDDLTAAGVIPEFEAL